MRSNQFDSILPEFGIQFVGVISIVTDQIFGRLRHKPLDESGRSQFHFMRRGTFYTDSNLETMAVCNRHDLGSLATPRLPDLRAPLFGWSKAPVDKGFLYVQATSDLQFESQSFQNSSHHSRPDPLLKSAMTGLA